MSRLLTTQLNHVALQVSDVEQSQRFYETVMCLEEIPRPRFEFPGAWFRLGVDQELHLIGGDASEVAERRSGANHFALMVDDMDACERFLSERGVAYLPRRVRPDGAFQIYLHDPDGHSIELCTRGPA